MEPNSKQLILFFIKNAENYSIDVLWGQPIKLAQVASTSELRENQQNNRLFFEIVPCYFCGPQKYKHKIGHNYFTF